MSSTTLIDRPAASTDENPRAPTPTIDVLVCGSTDRGDDGAPLVACQLLEADRPPNARIRRVGQLDVDDLLSIAPGGGAVIVDSATGIDPGVILELPLRALLDTEASVQPRSSHALAIPEVIGLADMIRGRPLAGRIVVIGARRFALGRPLTRRVAKAVPMLAQTIRLAVERLARSPQEPPEAGSPLGGR